METTQLKIAGMTCGGCVNSVRRVLLAVPSNEATWLDEYVRSEYELHGHLSPDWLDEHIEFGLPSPAANPGTRLG